MTGGDGSRFARRAAGFAGARVAAARALWFRASVSLPPRLAFSALLALAVAQRVGTWLRRRRGARPRLVWGPFPIISAKYWSEAMSRAGYESRTCVFNHYAIHRREDFDVYLDRFAGDSPRSAQLAPYRFLAWAMRHGDVFLRFFDGGFLRHTPHAWDEARLLRLAGKKVVASPYGSDVAVAGHLGGLEDEFYADYPALRERSDEIARWVEHTAKWADVIIRNWQLGYLPRHDVVWLSQLAIDLDTWSVADDYSDADGGNGPVSVVHAPNHRAIKGTAHLEAAVADLREDGLAIELELVEGRPNEEVRAAMRAADVVADQFLLPGYAMAAVEAMAVGKPVIVNMSGLPDRVKATEAFERCPAVDSNPARLKEDLRRLVTDPGLRRERGRAGRRFVEEFHSYEAVAAGWEQILGHLWGGAPLPATVGPRRALREPSRER